MYDLVLWMQDFLTCFSFQKRYGIIIYFIIQKSMNKIDRIFIAGLVILICLSGIYAVKSFSKGREAINVVGEGKVELPPNQITMTINTIFSGNADQSLAAYQTEQKEIEKIITPLGFKIINAWSSFRENQRYENRCYTQNGYIVAPCRDSYTTITSSGDKIIENGEKLIQLFSTRQNTEISSTELSISNGEEYIEKARLLALQDAKQMAQKMAKALDVDLGRLLQSTEYGLSEDQYYNDPQTYTFKQEFSNNESIKEVKTISIIRKAYLTYDID